MFKSFTFQPLLTSPGNPPAAVTIVVSGFADLLINPTTCAYVGIGEFVGVCKSSTNLFHFENSAFVVLSQFLSNLKLFSSFKISSIKLPENVEPTIRGRDFVIATVAAPTVIKEPEKPAETEEGAEGAEAAAATGEGAAETGDAKDAKGAEGEKKEADKKEDPKKGQPEKK